MEQEQSQTEGTEVHQSSKTEGKANIKITNNFPHKKISLKFHGIGKIHIKTNPNERVSLKIKSGRKVKLRRA